jgi:hypothetical protein
MYNEDDEDAASNGERRKVLQEGHGLLPYPLAPI